MLEQIGFLIIATTILIAQIAIYGYLYDKVHSYWLNKKSTSPAVNQLKLEHVHLPLKKLNEYSLTIINENQITKIVLGDQNFERELAPYFIATNHIFSLWKTKPFNIYFSSKFPKYKANCDGFICYNNPSDIHIINKGNTKQQTGILLHEIAHNFAHHDAQHRRTKIQSHGKEFKKTLRNIFYPLLINDQYFKNHKELKRHLIYEISKYSPPNHLCY